MSHNAGSGGRSDPGEAPVADPKDRRYAGSGARPLPHDLDLGSADALGGPFSSPMGSIGRDLEERWGPASASQAVESDVALRNLAREAARLLRVRRVAVWRFGEGGGSLHCLARHDEHVGPVEPERAHSGEIARGLAVLLEQLGSLVLADVSRSGGPSTALADWIRSEEIRGLLIVPVWVKGSLTGLVRFEETLASREWSVQDTEIAMTLARQAGQILARMNGGYRRPLAAASEPAAPESAEPSSFSAPGSQSMSESSSPSSMPGPFSTPGSASTRRSWSGLPKRASSTESPGPAAAEPAPAPPSAPRPDPVASARQPLTGETEGPRSEVRTEVERRSLLERAALIFGEDLGELLGLLEVQGGYLSLLNQSASDSSDDGELVQEARECGGKVWQVLDRFLRHLKAPTAERESLDLNQLLSAMIPALAQAAGPDLRLRVAPASESFRIEVNAELLQRAMTHVVRNAREASPAGSDLRICWGRATGVEGEPVGGSMAKIRIEDQGDGIPAEHLPRIFEPFFTTREGVDEANSRGLGLPAVQAIVEAHGGRVFVTSRPGRGTAVEIRLPLGEGDPAAGGEPLASPRPSRSAEPADPAPSEARPEARSRPSRVLLLEDDPFLARLIERTLSRGGFQVETRGTAAEAHHRWRSLLADVDLLVVERRLSDGGSGVDFAAALRRENPEVAVVVLDRRSKRGGGAAEAGGFPILTRPFEPADVLALVREQLRTGRVTD